jgi:hypothetical protein
MLFELQSDWTTFTQYIRLFVLVIVAQSILGRITVAISRSERGNNKSMLYRWIQAHYRMNF